MTVDATPVMRLRSDCTATRDLIMQPHSHRHGRDYYLSDVPLDEALDRFRTLLDRSGLSSAAEAETIALTEARGRVTAAPVWAVETRR